MAQPGWYPAETPAKERWWDGTQWTAYERDAVAPPPAPPAPLASIAPVVPSVPAAPDAAMYHPQASGPQHPPSNSPAAWSGQTVAPAMGWYLFPSSGQGRWWNGQHWTAYHLKNGRPAVESFAIEPPSMGWVMGGLFAVVGLMNLLRAMYDATGLLVAVIFLVSAGFWITGAVRDQARRKVAAPMSAPLLDGSLRPFPGEAEGQSAGWYPVSGSVVRWWTGARWADYIADKGRVRPTQYGPRAYRTALITLAVLGGLGAIALIFGIILTAGVDSLIGIAGIIFGAILLVVAGIAWLVTHLRRYTLLLPPNPPQQF